MTIEVTGIELTYDVRTAEDERPRYELVLGYREDGTDGLERLELDVDSRRDLTKAHIREQLESWTAAHPDRTLEQFAALEVAVCRTGQTTGDVDAPTYEEVSAARHPQSLVAEDDEWEELAYKRGEKIRYSVGGPGNGVYGTRSGEIVATHGSGRSYRVDVAGEEKRVPESWILGSEG